MKYHHVAWFGVVLTLCVIVFGAFVRLSDAGLGCPDWPGCFGHLAWPDQAHEIDLANKNYADRPVDVEKAWKEMVHRYLAGSLGLLVAGLFVVAVRQRQSMNTGLPFILLLMVIGQGLLGKLTVTLKLHPSIVMSHLLGGLLVLILLSWLALSKTESVRPYRYGGYVKQWMVSVGMLLLFIQIALGGWTSSNYAALACVGFPQCNGVWWPEMNFTDAFDLFRGYGPNYEFGVLDAPNRIAIQMAHRFGFIVLTIYLFWLIFRLSKNRELLSLGLMLAFALVIQVSLGIANVTLGLPLSIATAHNAVAAILVLIMTVLLYKTRRAV